MSGSSTYLGLDARENFTIDAQVGVGRIGGARPSDHAEDQKSGDNGGNANDRRAETGDS